MPLTTKERVISRLEDLLSHTEYKFRKYVIAQIEQEFNPEPKTVNADVLDYLDPANGH